MILFATALATVQPPQQSLEAIDEAVATFLSGTGVASPVDRRLRLPACERPLDVADAGAAAVAVRCSRPIWALRVPRRGASAAMRGASTPLVRAGEVVQLSIRRGGFRVATQGTLLDGGGEGARVRVRTQRDRPPVSGIVQADGSVASGG